MRLKKKGIYVLCHENGKNSMKRVSSINAGEVAKFEKLVKSMNGKLANEKFIANAPSDVVEKERERLVEYGETLERLRDSLQRIS